MDRKFQRTIGQLMLFLNWEMDEWAVFLLPLVLSLPTKKLWIGIGIGGVLMTYYSKLKRTKPSGFIVHFLASKGIVSFKKLPPTHYPEFRK